MNYGLPLKVCACQSDRILFGLISRLERWDMQLIFVYIAEAKMLRL